ncbi:ureide permease 2-like [Silene latifolia]|uniref:ureide permease 2-like n=1 Tax=Silene latifolia TaxID=37657 RepID=UPI003D7748AB
MFLVESKAGAIACMLLSLLLLGTWPAILTLLERRGRLPQHTYLDYSITNFLAAVVIALTFGQIGDSKPNMPNFITQLSQDTWPCVLMAMLGGLFLSLGNVSIQYAWAFVGLSVAQVITSSIAVVIGTSLNYFLDDKINKASILFPGVACFLTAVLLGATVHSSNAADNVAKLRSFHENMNNTPDVPENSNEKGGKSEKDILEDIEVGDLNAEETKKAGTAESIIAVENQRAIKVVGKSRLVGLSITFFAGICFALFSPAFNLATNDQWHFLKKGVPHLVIYTAFFYFSLSFVVIAVALNVIFLYRPLLDLPKSSFKAYLKDGDGRAWAVFAGLLCGFGNGLQFIGGQAAGYAAADAVQALPLVSTFWGVIFFGEYRRSSKRTYIYLVSMLLMFSVAVALLLASAGHRKTASNGLLDGARHLQHSRRQSASFYAGGSFDM